MPFELIPGPGNVKLVDRAATGAITLTLAMRGHDEVSDMRAADNKATLAAFRRRLRGAYFSPQAASLLARYYRLEGQLREADALARLAHLHVKKLSAERDIAIETVPPNLADLQRDLESQLTEWTAKAAKQTADAELLRDHVEDARAKIVKLPEKCIETVRMALLGERKARVAVLKLQIADVAGPLLAELCAVESGNVYLMGEPIVKQVGSIPLPTIEELLKAHGQPVSAAPPVEGEPAPVDAEAAAALLASLALVGAGTDDEADEDGEDEDEDECVADCVSAEED